MVKRIAGHSMDVSKIISVERLIHPHWAGLYGIQVHFTQGSIRLPGLGMGCDERTVYKDGSYSEETLQKIITEIEEAMTQPE